MKYSECKPIEGAQCSAWLVTSVSKQELHLFHKDAKIEDVTQQIAVHKEERFIVKRVDVGTFVISDSRYFSGDARELTSSFEIICYGEMEREKFLKGGQNEI